MVLRGEPVGEQDVADQRRAFRRPRRMRRAYAPRLWRVRGDADPRPKAERVGVYSFLARRTEPARRTLKTGYCDR